MAPYIHARAISESKLWSLMSASSYRFENNPLAKIEALKIALPKTRGTLRAVLEQTLNAENKKLKNKPIPSRLEAYVKLVGIEDYNADDNPPIEILKQIGTAKQTNLFTVFFVAYPMIGETKQIDPIVIGAIQNPQKHYANVSSIGKVWFNGDAPFEYLKSLDFGEMFRIAEWM